jgi:hypothetical protein
MFDTMRLIEFGRFAARKAGSNGEANRRTLTFLTVTHAGTVGRCKFCRLIGIGNISETTTLVIRAGPNKPISDRSYKNPIRRRLGAGLPKGARDS